MTGGSMSFCDAPSWRSKIKHTNCGFVVHWTCDWDVASGECNSWPFHCRVTLITKRHNLATVQVRGRRCAAANVTPVLTTFRPVCDNWLPIETKINVAHVTGSHFLPLSSVHWSLHVKLADVIPFLRPSVPSMQLPLSLGLYPSCASEKWWSFHTVSCGPCGFGMMCV